jgi:hypothetical protein
MSGGNAHYELAARTRAVGAGGVGLMHRLARRVGLVEAIDKSVKLIRQPKPYLDSDHVLNIALLALSGGRALEDLDVRRTDDAYVGALGARSIPDPTTAGDYCRRFDEAAVWRLMDSINSVRQDVWRAHPTLTSQTARIDADGSIVETAGKTKQSMDVSYNGKWGYQPLLVSMANTQEPLFIVNRPANRPSHEGAPAVLDRAIGLCRNAGFKDILLRGDTAFSMTRYLDGWDEQGVRFVFGYDAVKSLVRVAGQIDEIDYAQLTRSAEAAFATSDVERRTRAERVKDRIIREREFLNLRLENEDVAEFAHKPHAAKRSYRIVVVRKTIAVERGQVCLETRFRYFFYITNDRTLTPEQIVREANHRCDQENLIAQLKSGVRSLHAPINTLVANWAYMVMTSLAWTLKAWAALRLPIVPRHRERHAETQRQLLRMEFRSFLERFILVPAQLIRRSRQLVLRLLAWRPDLHTFFRLFDAL